MINSTLDFNFEHGVNRVFEHVIHCKDFEKWNPIKEVQSVVSVEDEGTHLGFITKSDIAGRVATIECEALYYEENKEVRYGVIRSVFEDGTDLTKSWSFPYSNLYQRLRFEGNEHNCSVIHEIKLEPKNWLGWLTCKFLVMPRVIEVANQGNRALNDYLSIT